MRRSQRRVGGRLARLAPVVVAGAVIAGFALLHVRLEVPRAWAGWAVLALVAPPAGIAIRVLASRVLRRRRARLRVPSLPEGAGSAAAAAARPPAAAPPDVLPRPAPGSRLA